MLPDEVYKRRHYGTPQSVQLIIANFTVLAVAISVFASEKHVNWFFWVLMGLLMIYNFLNLKKDREEYNRVRIIAYVVSVLLMIGFFLAVRSRI